MALQWVWHLLPAIYRPFTWDHRDHRDRANCRAICWWAAKVKFCFTFIVILILCLLLDQGRIGAVLLTNSSAEWGNLNLVNFVVGVQSSFVAWLMVTSSNKPGAASFGGGCDVTDFLPMREQPYWNFFYKPTFYKPTDRPTNRPTFGLIEATCRCLIIMIRIRIQVLELWIEDDG